MVYFLVHDMGGWIGLSMRCILTRISSIDLRTSISNACTVQDPTTSHVFHKLLDFMNWLFYVMNMQIHIDFRNSI